MGHRLVDRLGRAFHQAGQHEDVGIGEEGGHIGLEAGEAHSRRRALDPLGGFGEHPAAHHQLGGLGRQREFAPGL